LGAVVHGSVIADDAGVLMENGSKRNRKGFTLMSVVCRITALEKSIPQLNLLLPRSMGYT